jgi:sugar (pentulose or hexulose) kinase
MKANLSVIGLLQFFHLTREGDVVAKYLGGDLSTTGFALGVQSVGGAEDIVSVKMIGATEWRGQPAFYISFLPEMMREALEKLALKGWEFSDPGAISFSVRQHDMVILDKEGGLLIPTLSW